MRSRSGHLELEHPLHSIGLVVILALLKAPLHSIGHRLSHFIGTGPPPAILAPVQSLAPLFATLVSQGLVVVIPLKALTALGPLAISFDFPPPLSIAPISMLLTLWLLVLLALLIPALAAVIVGFLALRQSVFGAQLQLTVGFPLLLIFSALLALELPSILLVLSQQ